MSDVTSKSTTVSAEAEVRSKNKPTLARPVVLMHGIKATSFGLRDMKKMIQKSFDNPMVYLADLTPEDPNIAEAVFDALIETDLSEFKRSFSPMWTQIAALRKYLETQTVPPNTKGAPSLATVPGGFDVICHSQGGILFRGYIAEYADHNVHTFLALSSPLMGQYGLSKGIFKHLIGHHTSASFYTDPAQKTLSVAGYWKDPTMIDVYHDKCKYLPKINNEVSHPKQKEYKDNFCKLKRIVLITGPHDGVITPWQSALFGYYKNGSTVSIVDMHDHPVYKSIGLDELDKKKCVFRYINNAVLHEDWDNDPEIFKTLIRPHLTPGAALPASNC